MRNINIQEVGMENFGPYIDPMVLEFKKNYLTLITGPNGIGKTVALDAIPFTFFNDTTKGAKGDDLVNNVIGKNCKTWVKFTVNDLDKYIITRYQKYTRLGNTVILNKNGIDIKKGHREVLPVIENLICSKRAFMNTLMFGQKVKDFFTDLVDSDKKLIFRELLSLILYDAYHTTTGDLLKEILLEISNTQTDIDISNGLLTDTKEQIQTILQLKKDFEKNQIFNISILEKDIRDLKRLLKEWECKTDDLMNKDIDIQTTEKEISKISTQLNQLFEEEKKEIEKIKQQQKLKIDDIQIKVSNAKNKVLEKSKSDVENIQNDINKYQKKKVELDTLNKDNKYQNKILKINIQNDTKYYEQQIQKISDNVLKQDISVCPTCQQEISKDIITKLKLEVKDFEKSIQTNTNKLDEIITKGNKEYKKYNQQHKIINQILSDLQNKRLDLQTAVSKKTNELFIKGNKTIEIIDKLATKDINKCIDTFIIKKESLIANKSSLIEIQESQQKVLNEIEKIKETIININNEINQKEYQLNNKKKEEYDKTQLKNYINKQKQIELKIISGTKSIEILQIKQKVLLFWKNAFSSAGIPSMLIDEAIPFMNERVSYYLDKFTSGRYIVSFDTIAETKSGAYRDKISVNVIDSHTRADNRVQLSGGQTRIIDIATILTLGDLQANIQGVSINILLFDEIFDSLDTENIGYVARVLNLIKENKSIYLISHRHIDELETDQILNFQK